MDVPASHHEIDSLEINSPAGKPNHMCALSIDVALPSYKILPPPYSRAVPTSLHTLGSTFSMTVTCALQSSFTFTQWQMDVSSEHQRRLLQDHVDSAAYTDMYRK